MEKLILNRRKVLQSLAVAMGALSIPKNLLAEVPTEVNAIEPIYIKAGTGKKKKIGDGDITFKFDKKQTDGHLGITESVLLPGILGAPPHSHKGFDEICRVTEGTLTIMVGKEIFKVNAGDWHLRPKGIVHSFWNQSNQPAKFIEIYSPGGHESYMNELSDLFLNHQRPKPGDLDLLAKKYDISFDWPKLQFIMDTYGVHL